MLATIQKNEVLAFLLRVQRNWNKEKQFILTADNPYIALDKFSDDHMGNIPEAFQDVDPENVKTHLKLFVLGKESAFDHVLS